MQLGVVLHVGFIGRSNRLQLGRTNIAQHSSYKLGCFGMGETFA